MSLCYQRFVLTVINITYVSQIPIIVRADLLVKNKIKNLFRTRNNETIQIHVRKIHKCTTELRGELVTSLYSCVSRALVNKRAYIDIVKTNITLIVSFYFICIYLRRYYFLNGLKNKIVVAHGFAQPAVYCTRTLALECFVCNIARTNCKTINLAA